MHFKQLIALTYAVTAAALAIEWTSDYTRSVHDIYQKQTVARTAAVAIPMKSVVTLARPVTFGHKLTPGDFMLTKWPVGSLPAGAFLSIEDVFVGGKDQFVKSEMFEGEVLLASKLNKSDQTASLSLLLPPDMRAVTIKINEVRGVGGFVQPNDRVDILLTELAAEKTKGSVRSSRVILQNIRILAMGQALNVEKPKVKVARSATLAVTLEQAQKLALATTVGQISMALRNPQQVMGGVQKAVSLADLRPKKKKTKASGKMQVIVHRAGTWTGIGMFASSN